MKRKDGEYILLAQDNGAKKVNMLRWRPSSAGQEKSKADWMQLHPVRKHGLNLM